MASLYSELIVKVTNLKAIDSNDIKIEGQLVRCRNCNYSKASIVNSNGFTICPASGMEITPDDYCSYAERETDDNTR